MAAREYAQHQQQTVGLEEEFQKAEVEAKSAAIPVARARTDVEQAEINLASLAKAGKDADSRFGDRLPILLQALEQNRRLFRRFPVGPVGRHISLLKPEWWAVVETALGNSLNGFIVTSKADMEVLSGIMRRVNW